MAKFTPGMLNGKPGNVTPGVKRTIARAVSHGLVVTSTTTGGHAASSWHYPRNNWLGLPRWRGKLGRAVDVAGPWHSMVAFQRSEYRRLAARFFYLELFGPDNNFCLKNGTAIRLAEHTPLEDLHDSHCHVAVRT